MLRRMRGRAIRRRSSRRLPGKSSRVRPTIIISSPCPGMPGSAITMPEQDDHPAQQFFGDQRQRAQQRVLLRRARAACSRMKWSAGQRTTIATASATLPIARPTDTPMPHHSPALLQQLCPLSRHEPVVSDRPGIDACVILRRHRHRPPDRRTHRPTSPPPTGIGWRAMTTRSWSTPSWPRWRRRAASAGAPAACRASCWRATRRRAPGGRGAALPQDQQLRRVHLRLGLGERRAARRRPLLPEAGRRHAVHARDRAPAAGAAPSRTSTRPPSRRALLRGVRAGRRRRTRVVGPLAVLHRGGESALLARARLSAAAVACSSTGTTAPTARSRASTTS